MSTEGARTNWESQVMKPYEPISLQPIGSLKAEDRIAHAMEYIAGQIGQINAKLDRIAASFPVPKR